MHKFLFIFAIGCFCLGLHEVSHAGLFGGPEQEQGQAQGQLQLQFQHQRANAGAEAAANSGGNIIRPKQDLDFALHQDIDLTENSLTTMAPNLSANGIDCNMESTSYSILVFSRGRSKCEKGSLAWRDFNNAINNGFGVEVALGMMCNYKKFRKVAHYVQLDGEPVNCKALLRRPRVASTPVVHEDRR